MGDLDDIIRGNSSFVIMVFDFGCMVTMKKVLLQKLFLHQVIFLKNKKKHIIYNFRFSMSMVGAKL